VIDDPSTGSGQSLAAQLAAHLDRSFERLVLTYQDRLYAFALRLSGSPQDAEEIAQDAFVRAYHALQGYDAARTRALALKPWLYQITLNVFRNRVRGRRLPLVALDGLGDGAEPEPEDDAAWQPEPHFEHAEAESALAAQVAALPERYRVAVVLRYVQELDYAEMAAVLGQPVGTVKSNVHRGIQMLRMAMTEHRVEVR
jgi:RNA polymerase sigma-70 factor (ECF subfamily)